MIDIICTGGTVLESIQIAYDMMRRLMIDGVIQEEDFLELQVDDESRIMIRKTEIISFYERM